LDEGSARRKAPTCIKNSKDTEQTRMQTFMPQVRFEPTIFVFQGAKAVRTIDRAATVIGRYLKLIN
jgi:hypothetical protein